MIRTAIYIAVLAWLTRLFIALCYRIGYAVGWTLTRLVLGLVAGAKMLFRCLHRLTVREIVPAPADHRERPAEQRPELVDQHVPVGVAAVVSHASSRNAARMVIHRARRRR